MRHSSTLIAALAVALMSYAATAAEFIVYPKSVKGPQGGSMFMIGSITAGDYDRFITAIKQWGPYPFSLTLRSQGGNVLEAIKIGRLARQLSLTVFAPNYTVYRPTSADCTYDNEERDFGRKIPCICASACTLVFLGGVNRMGAEIYVHSIAYDKGMFGSLTPQQADAMYKRAMTDVREYLQQMDVEDSFISMMTGTSSSNLRKVTAPLGWQFQVPSFREWLSAKCGHPPTSSPAIEAWAKCTIDVQNKAQVEAIKQLISQSP
jgi:hypothetical protein